MFHPMSATRYVAEGKVYDKFPHTGPVYYGTGARPYTASLKGRELLRKDGRVREFKTVDAANAAIVAEANKGA